MYHMRIHMRECFLVGTKEVWLRPANRAMCLRIGFELIRAGHEASRSCKYYGV